MNVSQFSLLVNLAAALISANSINIKNIWTNGNTKHFDARIQLVVSGGHDMSSDGWTIKLTFNQAVSSLNFHGNANIDSNTGTEIIISNVHQQNYEPGSTFTLDFLGEYSQDPLSGTAEWSDGSSSGSTAASSSTAQAASTASTASSGGCTTYTPQVLSEWNGGYRADITLTVGQTVTQWDGTITFSHDTTNLEAYTAEVTGGSTDTRTYELENKSWNGRLTAGQMLTLEYLVRYTPGITANRDPCLYLSFSTSTGSSSTTASTQSSSSTTEQSSSSSTTTPSSPVSSERGYEAALGLSMLFYEAQRSGALPADNQISWRGDSSLDDGNDVGLDLSGGWHDAGDHVKFGFPMANSAVMLLYGMIFFKDGYVAAGQLTNATRQIKWPLDYFLKCSQNDGIFYGQVGEGGIDHSYWGSPENMNVARPTDFIDKDSTSGGADLVGETVSALAAGSIYFQSIDPAYSAQLLSRATSLYDLMKETSLQGFYQNAIGDANGFYKSHHFHDEKAQAAAWMSYAYNEDANGMYLNDAKTSIALMPRNGIWAASWDDKTAITNWLIYHLTGDSYYLAPVESFLSDWRNSVTKTPLGLAWRDQWGALRYSANTALVAMLAASKGSDSTTNEQFAQGQINYMLGEGANTRSYVVGYGNNYPKKPHHRAASCDRNSASCDINDSGDNPNTLYGALVGGPDANDYYEDVRTDYIKNEVACDYNAGFSGALAGLIQEGYQVAST